MSRWSIGAKLQVLVGIPLAATIAFAALSVVTSANAVIDTGRARAMISVADRADDLAVALQAERADAASLLATASHTSTPMRTFEAGVAATTVAQQAYTGERQRLAGVPDALAVVLQRIDAELAELPVLRKQIEASSAVLSAAVFQYRIVIADLLSYGAGVSQAGVPADVANEIRAGAALAQAREDASDEQVAVVAAAAAGDLTPAAQEQITGARTGYTDSLAQFVALASPTWVSWLENALTGTAVVEAQRLEDEVGKVLPGGKVDVDGRAFATAMSARVASLATVGSRANAATLQNVTAYHDQQKRTAMTEGISVAVIAVLVLLLGLVIGRPIISRLRRLSDHARNVAYNLLPDVVNRLRQPNGLAGHTPAEFAAKESLGTLSGLGSDEVAEVGAAFGAVIDSAVLLAAEQADDRADLGVAFVAVARRGDQFVHQLTRLLDQAEKDEANPRALDTLFQLDNLTARLGRSNRNLLILGDQSTAVVRDRPVPLPVVIRAAGTRIERYQNVEIRSEMVEKAVKPDAVDDLVHMFAELLDNATAFSEPTSPTFVDCHDLGDRVVVFISDSGIGMSDAMRAELNERLSTPQAIKYAIVRTMGLPAVAKIAARYGIRVELKSHPMGARGTRVEVTMPLTAFSADRAVEGPARGMPLRGAGWPLPSDPGGRSRPPALWPSQALEQSSIPALAGTPGPDAGRRAADATAEMPLVPTDEGSWFTRGTIEWAPPDPDAERRLRQLVEEAQQQARDTVAAFDAGPSPFDAPPGYDGMPYAGTHVPGPMAAPGTAAYPPQAGVYGTPYDPLGTPPLAAGSPRPAAGSLGSAASDTDRHLPRRVAMANLAPELAAPPPPPPRPSPETDWRDPDQVAATVNAFGRGVSHSRSNAGNPEAFRPLRSGR